jgi:hypothetical protein
MFHNCRVRRDRYDAFFPLLVVLQRWSPQAQPALTIINYTHTFKKPTFSFERSKHYVLFYVFMRFFEKRELV